MQLAKPFNTAVTDTVIFLDFDGPLSNYRVYAQADNNLDFDPIAVRILQNVCEVANARIVCTSVRTFPNWQIFNETKRLFTEAGMDISVLHPDWTVNKKYDHKRKDSIEDYLELHPEIKNYVIVDDEHVDIPEKLVLVDQMNGIMSEDLEKICDILGIDIGDVFKRDFYRTYAGDQYVLVLDHWDQDTNDRIDKRHKKAAEEKTPKP